MECFFLQTFGRSSSDRLTTQESFPLKRDCPTHDDVQGAILSHVSTHEGSRTAVMRKSTAQANCGISERNFWQCHFSSNLRNLLGQFQRPIAPAHHLASQDLASSLIAWQAQTPTDPNKNQQDWRGLPGPYGQTNMHVTD